MSLWRQLTGGLRAPSGGAVDSGYSADEGASLFLLNRRRRCRPLHIARAAVRARAAQESSPMGDCGHPAIGVGNRHATALFSAVNPILFEPLPYPNANRIAMILEIRNDGGQTPGNVRHVPRVRGAESLVRRDRGDQDMAADRHRSRRGRNDSMAACQRERLPCPRRVTDRGKGLRSRPTIGLFGRRSCDALRRLVGRRSHLDDNLYTVIGVMPGGFENVLAPSAALWAPLHDTFSSRKGERVGPSPAHGGGGSRCPAWEEATRGDQCPRARRADRAASRRMTPTRSSPSRRYTTT